MNDARSCTISAIRKCSNSASGRVNSHHASLLNQSESNKALQLEENGVLRTSTSIPLKIDVCTASRTASQHKDDIFLLAAIPAFQR